jgi:hypothetical protein
LEPGVSPTLLQVSLPPLALTILADVTAGPRFGVVVPCAVVPEIQGLLPGEGPPGLGWTDKGRVRQPVGLLRWRGGAGEGKDVLGKRVGPRERTWHLR